jgi:glyoxylase-like metal-dependent hydrolase (beta-lactamase superfamily II)
LQDINTLIDVGTDGSVITEIEKINTGAGKRPVEQIIITREHFEHAGGMEKMKSWCDAKIYAYKKFYGVDEVLRGGQTLRIGDREFEVIHVAGHSSDSICLYCKEGEILFSGDTPLRIMTAGGSYSVDFIDALEKLMRCNIKTVYPGHEKPIQGKAKDLILMRSLVVLHVTLATRLLERLFTDCHVALLMTFSIRPTLMNAKDRVAAGCA